MYYVYYLKDDILKISAHNNEFFNEKSHFKIEVYLDSDIQNDVKNTEFVFSIDSKNYYPLISENETVFDYIEILKYDFEESIFSCKFSFDVYNKELDKTYKIKNSRVDAKFDKNNKKD